jgi:hypothetical protein
MGSVWVKSPLLDQPLTGPAYAVSGYGNLPHLAFILNGQVTLIPQAESASDKTGRLRTIVPVIPDAPVGHFRLTLLGGKKGYLTNTKDLCNGAGAGSIAVEYRAQSGKRTEQNIRPQTPCADKR